MSKTTTGKTVRSTLPVDAPLSREERDALARLAAMQDRGIDFSDIPRSPRDADWYTPGIPFSAENKRQITLRLDADVLDFFRQSGKRYQTRINSVLRAYMQAHASPKR